MPSPWRPIPEAQTRPKTITAYVKLAKSVQGFVVVGMPEHEKRQLIGARLRKFCQFSLQGVELLIFGLSSLAEWTAQAQLFQVHDPNKPEATARGRYCRCELVPARAIPLPFPKHKIAAAVQAVEAQTETAKQRARRYELTLKAIASSTLCGVDFGDWVQAAAEDALAGLWPECYQCGTAVHEGPCVGEDAPS